MTIEEKAKAYDEALERANEYHFDGAKQCIIDTLEYVFPVLKESEDERIRKEIISLIQNGGYMSKEFKEKAFSWLEKQGKCGIDCPQNHQDSSRPNGGIVLEDFNGGEGFYKLNLDYLNKKQVEEVEEMVRMWNKDSKASNDNIKSCIGMCLTDTNEQRFNDYNTSLKDCLAWLEKQGQVKDSQIPQHEKKTSKENDNSLTNEDERIRKEIIYHIKNCDDTIDEHTEKRMLDWLEKQNKQILANSAKTCKDEQKLSNVKSNGEEWSKEDEKEWKSIVSVLTRMHFLDELDWLRSKLKR